MILDLIFVRHGISCANLIQRAQYGFHLLYRDPELAKTGIDVSKAVSADFIKNVNKRWLKEPYTIGASRMIRAQQTAYHMIASTLNIPINIFAHVGEAGLSLDNYSVSVADQIKFYKTSEPGLIDLLLLGKDGREPQNLWDKANFDKFLEWASANPEYFALGSDGRYRAIIFTHSHFLLNAFNMHTVINNNDAIHTIIDTKKPLRRRFEYWIMNRVSPDFSCPDGCRKSTCTNKKGGLRKRTTRKRKLVPA